jgi:hypothetical protein
VTHDELLSRIDKNWDADYDYCDDRRTKALRAVVELHKPYSGVLGITCTCDPHNEYLMGYPCDTIQAIEKELS